MGPKISAVMRFIQSGGREAIIAELSKLKEAIQGKSGTHVMRVAA
jgi:carbamate kinase